MHFHYFGHWLFHELLIMRFHRVACAWQVWRLFQLGTVNTHTHPSHHTHARTHTRTLLFCHMFYCIRNKCEMVIQINTCDQERNFVCNWLCIEILIEVYFNAVWISFVLFMHVLIGHFYRRRINSP